MAKYTVQNPEGKKVTFEWNHNSPPTDADMEEVFSAVGNSPKPESHSSGASGSWGEASKPIPSMSEALLPAYSEAKKTGGGLGRQALGVGSDVLTGALRLPIAAGRTLDTKIGSSGDHAQSYRESLGQINRGENPLNQSNIISGMASDAATIPSMLIGGPGVATVGKTALTGLKAGLVSSGLHQGDRIARGQGANLGDAAIETGLNVALPVAGKGLGALVKGGVSKLKTIISKFSDVNEDALKAASNPETLNAAKDMIRRTGGDLSEVADNLGQKIQGMQADEANAIASVNARRQNALQEGIQTARPWADNLDVSPFEAGKRIETAAKEGMQGAGERFGRGQDDILINRGIGKKGLQFGGVDGNQTPFEQTVDKYLADAGVGQGGKNYGVIGNVSIPAGAINEIRAMKGVFQTGLNTRDMLDQLRLVDNRLSFGGDAGGRLFAPGSQEDLAMKGIRARLADDLENQIGRAAGKNKNEVLALWGTHREAYHKTAQAFEQIQDGISAGKVNQEAYFNRIKNIGVQDLRKLAEESKKNPDLRGTWNELRKGFFDNIIASGVKDDGIDYQAIKKVWDNMDDDLKTVMMPTKVISHVDGVLDRTAPLDFKGQLLADGNRMVGKDRQALIGSLENIGSKAKRTDLEDLKTLDDLLGLEGKDRFSEQAGSFYLGKQIGLTDKGDLPFLSGSRNGKSSLGLKIGTSLGSTIGAGVGVSSGGLQGGAEGGATGLGIGALAGLAMQSPAGALAAYKLLNQIRKGMVMGEKKIARPLASHGLSSGRLTRTLTTPQFDGRQNK